MAASCIRVLGPVELHRDGFVVPLSRQESLALALLASAADGPGVPREELIDALWSTPPSTDRLSPLLSHLRRHLTPAGLTVSKAHGGKGHRLEGKGDTGASVSGLVDAKTFVDLVETGERLLPDDPLAAHRVLTTAAHLWAGLPYGVPGELPSRLRIARGRLEERRGRLVRGWARACLRTETHDLLDHPDLLAETDDDGVWLLRVVRALSLDARAEAEDLIERRRKSTGRYDDLVTLRAFDLLGLAEQGVPVHSRPDPATVEPPPTRGSAALEAAVSESAADRPRPGRSVREVDADLDDAIPWLAATARGHCVTVVRADGPAPVPTLAGALFSLVLRDHELDPTPWTARCSDLSTGADEGLVGSLLDRVGAHHRLLLVLTAEHRALATRLLERARHRRVGVLVLGSPTTTGDDDHAPGAWTAAAVVVENAGRIDPVDVRGVLAEAGSLHDPDAGFAAAVAAGVVTVEPVPGFADNGARREASRQLWSDPGRARGLHAAAYRVLTTTPTRRAEHAWRARPLLDDDEVARALLAAARRERADRHGEVAATLTQRALTIAVDPALRFDLLLCQGDAHHDEARMAAAAASYEAAAHAADDSLERRTMALVRLARRWTDPGRTDDDLVGKLSALRDELAAHGDRASWLQVSAHLAHLTTTGSGVPTAHEVLAALDDQPLEDEVLCDVLVECRWALFDHVAPSRARELSERLDRASVAAGSVHYRGEAHVCGVVDLFRLGRITDARRLTESHRDLVARHGHGLGPWLVSCLDTLFDLYDGDLARADARLARDEAWMMSERPTRDRSDSLRQTWIGQTFWLRREQGRSAELLRGEIGRMVTQRTFFPIWTAGAALLAADCGLSAAAAEQIRLLIDALDDFPPHGWSVPTLALLAEALDALHRAGAGDLVPVARTVERALAPHAAEVVLAGWPTVLLGPVARFRSRLALVCDEPERALAVLDDAPPDLPSYQRTWLHLLRARALADLGGDSGTAAELLADAARIAKHHDAAALAREVDEAVVGIESILRHAGLTRDGAQAEVGEEDR